VMIRRLWDTLKAAARLEADLTDLRSEHQRLAADFSQLRMEWGSTLDKIVAWSGRQAKRDARALDRLKQEEGPPEVPLHLTDKDQLRRIARQKGLRV